jgi:hypothetical protein
MDSEAQPSKSETLMDSRRSPRSPEPRGAPSTILRAESRVVVVDAIEQ